ncbi:uncharacterized protein LOC120292776 [Eucalyptus grandis]|uniref:uncharacterized protein LOC120292776 n=1 Tax=Eucalyptus grandis TaxID=71139 RepID=UPI00192ED0D1|nr:uncharacterized protein LOC120292776 [Eucalyptus grandis]
MSVKGRKVSGRGETVAANYAFGPLEDDVMIKHRLPAPQQQEVNRHWRNFQRNSPPSSSKLRRTKITMEAGVSGLQSKTHMKLMLKCMRGRKMLKLFCNQVGSSKKFLLSTLPEGPQNDQSTSTVELNLQTEKPSSHSKGERKTQ